jgi:lipid II:glycine glycyltransferase (peptidoglycan interpeptide bridge formation enzyme)
MLRDMVEPNGPNIVVTPCARPNATAVQEWDRFVECTPGSDVTQLSSWAAVRRNAGYRPLYVFAHQDGRLVGGALVLERRLPLVGRIGYVSNGPIVSSAVPRGPVVGRLGAALHYLARRRLRALFAQPPVDAHDVTAELRARGFRYSEAGIAPSASVGIDLARDVEDLRTGLARSNRRRTRLWAEHGVTVRMGSFDDIPLVADLVARTAEHRRFAPLSAEYIATLYRALDEGQHVVVFVAELDGVPVAAQLSTRCGGVVRQRLLGMDRSERARREGVTAATVWHAMLWAKASGYHTYDLGGISRKAARLLLDGEPASRLTGTEQFKASFGGTAYLYPEPVELISSPARLAYDLSRRTRAGGRVVEIAKRVLRGGRG